GWQGYRNCRVWKMLDRACRDRVNSGIYSRIEEPQTTTIRCGSTCFMDMRPSISAGKVSTASPLSSEKMIDSFIGAFETLADIASGRGLAGGTRVSRVGMPNGFFLNDLLWFGDGASKRTAISRGFVVEPSEISAFSIAQLNDLHERLRILLGILGEEYTLQIQWSIDSDYLHELETYHRETLELRRRDPVYGQFGVLIRAE